MKKEKVPFSQLKLHPPYRAFRRGKDGVVGHDTESLLSGYAFLITDSLGNHQWVISPEGVVKWLSNPLYSRTFNTFWNMDFDVTVLFKWLGKEFVKQLITYGCAYFNDVYFEYIPKRLLIVRKGNMWNTFFDASQYYMPRSLDGASKNYLSDAKIHVGSKEFTEADYGNEKILEYCLYDSKLCRNLTQLLLEDLHEMGFDPSTLSSPGTIMEEALVGAVYFPDVTKIPSGAFEYAYNAYRGGWMECFKRGYFSRLWDYDISSAYPYQVSELVDLEGGTWHYVDDGGLLKGAEYGFIYCLVDIRSDISPIIYRTDVNTTPRGRWYTTLTLDECRFIQEHKLGIVTPLRGWFFLPSPQAYKRLWAPMRKLFRQRKKLRNKWLPKSMSVSLYGKFAERDETGRTGNLLNFVYASTITARTRLQIARSALLFPSHLVIVAADGLTFDAPLPSTALSKDFGGLRLVHNDEGVVIGTNVCTIRGRYSGGSWRPGRFDWLKLLRENPDDLVFQLKHFRYTTLAEGVADDFKLWDEIGVFKEFPYDFNLNFDHKRIYHRVSCARELMEGQFSCHPWEVGITERRKELWELK